jgi:hypothetical protein
MDDDSFHICLCENKILEDVLDIIKNAFTVKYLTLFEWSTKKENIERLNLSSLKYGGFNPKTSKINVIIYTAKDDVDGNSPDDVQSQIKSTYGKSVLLTSNKDDYDYISLLIFSIDELHKFETSSQWTQKIKTTKRDLIAAEGWPSFEECFKSVNLTNNWVVLRNSEYLPDNFFGNDKDVDLLCENLEKFVKSINARKRHDGISSYFVIINKVDVEFDIRYLGDDYYDKNWQISLLKNKIVSSQSVPELKDDIALYSVLYHALIHKQQIKPKYLNLFTEYFSKPFEEEKNLEFLLSKLNHYMALKKYKAVYPLDSLCLYSFNYNNFNFMTSRYKYKLSELRIDVVKVKMYNFLLKLNSNILSKLTPKFIRNIILRGLTKND